MFFYEFLLKVVFGLGGALAASVWCLPLYFSAIGMTGAGHGSPFFFILMVSHAGLGLALWPTVGFLLVFRSSTFAAWTSALLLAANYIGAVWWLVSAPDYPMDGVRAVWKSLPSQTIGFTVWFALGQLIFWSLIFTTKRQETKWNSIVI